jgi:hypothetical protein
METFLFCIASLFFGLMIGKPKPKEYTIDNIKDDINITIERDCIDTQWDNHHSSLYLHLARERLIEIVSKIERCSSD